MTSDGNTHTNKAPRTGVQLVDHTSIILWYSTVEYNQIMMTTTTTKTITVNIKLTLDQNL